MNLAVATVAVFFAGMGVVALLRPALVWAPFGATPGTPEARNEIRAVYGGFGVAIAILLVVTDDAEAAFRDGVLVTVAVALFGMAAGRVLGAVAEPRALLHAPGLFLVVELGLAGLLTVAR